MRFKQSVKLIYQRILNIEYDKKTQHLVEFFFRGFETYSITDNDTKHPLVDNIKISQASEAYQILWQQQIFNLASQADLVKKLIDLLETIILADKNIYALKMTALEWHTANQHRLILVFGSHRAVSHAIAVTEKNLGFCLSSYSIYLKQPSKDINNEVDNIGLAAHVLALPVIIKDKACIDALPQEIRDAEIYDISHQNKSIYLKQIRKSQNSKCCQFIENIRPQAVLYLENKHAHIKLDSLKRTELLSFFSSRYLSNTAFHPRLFKFFRRLLENIPGYQLHYSEQQDLETFTNVLAQHLKSSFNAIEAQNFAIELQQFGSQDNVMTQKKETKPEPTKMKDKKKLTIGMATYDDYDGVYFSTQALRLYHSDVMEQCEIVVIDNNPTGATAKHLKNLENVIDNYRYIPYCKVQSTIVRNQIFIESNADYVLCIDSHVFIVEGAIQRLLDYYDANPKCNDLLQGPLLYDNLNSLSTHFEPKWRGGMYGVWGHDKRGDDIDGEPFDIPMQGLGLFSSRKEAWLGFNEEFSGFGGEEGYIHEKYRQQGRRALCLPFLRWVHRFTRISGAKYRNAWEDRIRNYIIGHQELNLALDDIKEHFIELLGEEITERAFENVNKELSNRNC